MSQPWDYIAKLVCIGDSGTGKSSLTIRLCEGRFSSAHDVTIGVEFGSRIVPVGPPANALDEAAPPAAPASPAPSEAQARSAAQKHMKLSLWDTAGQETYKSVTRSYFRGASGALLVYDISRRDTFAHVQDWLADLRAIAEPDIVVVLVGNKCDLTSSPSSSAEDAKRQVSTAEAEAWCAANGVLAHVETSAKSGAGVERAFLAVAQRIWQNIEAGRYDLNDRRSGVKGAGGGANAGARAVRLNDAARRGGAGCC
ncbi:MAG: hypothetical protein M1832_005113 [Thelocarpon impressellum]|nr:MAG: hypothetical protein M1832_005113 [Thelocarpon impressellum]